MKCYGIDYLSDDDSIQFFVIDADNLDDAKEKARRTLQSYGLPKRNLINIEYLSWLDK